MIPLLSACVVEVDGNGVTFEDELSRPVMELRLSGAADQERTEGGDHVVRIGGELHIVGGSGDGGGEAEIERARDQLASFDRNGDGVVDIEQVLVTLEGVEVRSHDVWRLVNDELLTYDLVQTLDGTSEPLATTMSMPVDAVRLSLAGSAIVVEGRAYDLDVGWDRRPIALPFTMENPDLGWTAEPSWVRAATDRLLLSPEEVRVSWDVVGGLWLDRDEWVLDPVMVVE